MLDKIKVLIVDDSRLVREVLTSILESHPQFNIVGAAQDPYVARDMVKQFRPDVMTLDVEMPKMDGISFLRNLMRLNPLPVVMVSTLTAVGSKTTLNALEIGAIDFIQKPSDLLHNMDQFSRDLVDKVETAAYVSNLKLRAFQARLKREQQSEVSKTLPKLSSFTNFAKRVICMGGLNRRPGGGAQGTDPNEFHRQRNHSDLSAFTGRLYPLLCQSPQPIVALDRERSRT